MTDLDPAIVGRFRSRFLSGMEPNDGATAVNRSRRDASSGRNTSWNKPSIVRPHWIDRIKVKSPAIPHVNAPRGKAGLTNRLPISHDRIPISIRKSASLPIRTQPFRVTIV